MKNIFKTVKQIYARIRMARTWVEESEETNSSSDAIEVGARGHGGRLLGGEPYGQIRTECRTGHQNRGNLQMREKYCEHFPDEVKGIRAVR